MNIHDTLWGDILLLAELLHARRRRLSTAAMCLALQILVVAHDLHAAEADLAAYFVRCTHASRAVGDLESAAAFEMAVDVARVHRGADVAQRRARVPRSIELGTSE
jgi:hypothetical protein